MLHDINLYIASGIYNISCVWRKFLILFYFIDNNTAGWTHIIMSNFSLVWSISYCSNITCKAWRKTKNPLSKTIVFLAKTETRYLPNINKKSYCTMHLAAPAIHAFPSLFARLRGHINVSRPYKQYFQWAKSVALGIFVYLHCFLPQLQS
jgi:hypothetical protein